MVLINDLKEGFLEGSLLWNGVLGNGLLCISEIMIWVKLENK